MFRIRAGIASSIVLFAAAFFVMAQDTASFPKKLVGQWEVAKGDTPPGFTLEFTADGKFFMRADVKGKSFELKGSYKLQGETLTSTITLGDKSKTEVHTITKLTDTELITKDDKGKIDEFKRKAK